MSQTIVHELSAPVQAHGEELRQLELRRPTVKEARQIKALPYKIDRDESVSVDLDVAAKYIAVCAGIPPSSVEQMQLSDLNTLAWAVTGFFLSQVSPEAKPEASNL